MTKAIRILTLSILMLISFQSAKAQSRTFSNSSLLSVKENRMKIQVRKFRTNEKTFKGFFQSKRKVAPKLSVELLDNSGIHLFSLRNMAFIPDLNVGAKFNAGIIINL